MVASAVPAVAAAAAHVAADGQGWRQVGELLVAFGLSSVIGLERQVRGKSAGLRTQAIVGTSAALILIVSKYGFSDVLSSDSVVLDPSRVAAQIVSGIGFLGAGLIITRRGAIRGLTTAASVWETAAIGMAAGAGLTLLAVVVTALHFVIVGLYTPLGHWLSARGHAERGYTVTYEDGRGVLREVITSCTRRGWTITSMSNLGDRALGHERDLVAVTLTLRGPGTAQATGILGDIDGVVRVDLGEDEDD